MASIGNFSSWFQQCCWGGTYFLYNHLFLSTPSTGLYLSVGILATSGSSPDVEMSQKESLPPAPPQELYTAIENSWHIMTSKWDNYKVKSIFEKDVSVKVQ